jgi:hypothetical protein
VTQVRTSARVSRLEIQGELEAPREPHDAVAPVVVLHLGGNLRVLGELVEHVRLGEWDLEGLDEEDDVVAPGQRRKHQVEQLGGGLPAPGALDVAEFDHPRAASGGLLAAGALKEQDGLTRSAAFGPA